MLSRRDTVELLQKFQRRTSVRVYITNAGVELKVESASESSCGFGVESQCWLSDSNHGVRTFESTSILDCDVFPTVCGMISTRSEGPISVEFSTSSDVVVSDWLSLS